MRTAPSTAGRPLIGASPSWVSSFGVQWWHLAPCVEARNAPRRILRTRHRALSRGTLHRRLPRALQENEDSMADERPIDEHNGTPASDASGAAPVPSRPRRSTVSD